MRSYLLKADAELFDRIDAAAGKGRRAEWIREAIEARLADTTMKAPPAPVAPKPEPVTCRKPTPRPPLGSEEYQAITAALVDHRYSVRQLAQHLGWNEMRVNKVVEKMERANMVRFERGSVILA